MTVEVGVVMALDTLVDPDCARPADLTGYGPIPAGLARDLRGCQMVCVNTSMEVSTDDDGWHGIEQGGAGGAGAG